MMRYKRKSRYTPVSAIAQTRAMGWYCYFLASLLALAVQRPPYLMRYKRKFHTPSLQTRAMGADRQLTKAKKIIEKVRERKLSYLPSFSILTIKPGIAIT